MFKRTYSYFIKHFMQCKAERYCCNFSVQVLKMCAYVSKEAGKPAIAATSTPKLDGVIPFTG